VHAGVGGIAPAALPEVRVNIIELPPSDHHFVAIRRIDSNRRLVRSVAKNIISVRINVCLETGEHAKLRNHAWRSLHFPRRRRWHVVFFERLLEWRLVDGRQRLCRSGGKSKRQKQYGG